MDIEQRQVSSKTMYMNKNQRNINRLRNSEEKDRKRKTNNTTGNVDELDEYCKSISLQEKSKNFLECYDELILLITSKTL